MRPGNSWGVFRFWGLRILGLETWREHFEFLAMLAVARIMRANFCPKCLRMVHVVEMCKLVDNKVVAKDFWYLHQADIERNGAI